MSIGLLYIPSECAAADRTGLTTVVPNALEGVCRANCAFLSFCGVTDVALAGRPGTAGHRRLRVIWTRCARVFCQVRVDRARIARGGRAGLPWRNRPGVTCVACIRGPILARCRVRRDSSTRIVIRRALEGPCSTCFA